MSSERRKEKANQTLFKNETVDKANYNPVKMMEKYFAKGDEDVKILVEKFYKKESSMKVLSSDERAQLISKLHQSKDYFGWIIGDILMNERDKINIEAENYRTGKSFDTPTFHSMNDFYDTYSEYFDFTLQSMYNYIRTREELDPETLKAIGMRKALLIIPIEDKKKKNALIKKIIEKKLTIEQVKEERSKLYNNNDYYSEKKEIRNEQVKELHKSHPISITQNDDSGDNEIDIDEISSSTKEILDDEKIDHSEKIKLLTDIIPRQLKDNERILTFKNRIEAEKFDIAFSKFELKIKEEMDKILLE